MIESWKVCTAHPDYEISDRGRIRHGSKIMKMYVPANGYLATSLPYKGKRRPFYIHQLVMSAFVGEPPSGIEIRHIDGNKLNNKLENLAYCTHTENMADKNIHGTHNKGERNGRAKLTSDQVIDIRIKSVNGWNHEVLSHDFNVSLAAISSIVNRKSWRHI